MSQKIPLILGVNAGSSSVKLSVFTVSPGKNTREATQVISAEVSNLTSPPCVLSIEPVGPTREDAGQKGQWVKKKELDEKFEDQKAAFKFLLEKIYNLEGIPGVEGKIKAEDISHVCHRIVHGGTFSTPQELNPKTVSILENLSDLAPLHNAASLPIVYGSLEAFPETTKNIAFFDSSFHDTLPDEVKGYMLSPDLTKGGKIRKYGFHGLSYSYILHLVSIHLGHSREATSLLCLHLGSGCSAAAILNGRSIATTMGLTPLEGLPGATRSGTVDPSAVFHMLSEASEISYKALQDVGITHAEEVLNKKSGWKALCGTSDFAEICKRAESGKEEDKQCKLALDILVDRIVEYLGGYFVKLGGEVDALVFAGGIGEKSALLRAKVVEKMACLGFGVEEDKNEECKVDEHRRIADITVGGGGKMNRVLVVRTDEAAEMARECCGIEKFWSEH